MFEAWREWYYNYFIFYWYGISILSFQASSDQTTIDVVLAFFVGLTISMYISVLSTIIVTCQVAWPSVIAVIPLLLLNIWYRVCCNFQKNYLMQCTLKIKCMMKVAISIFISAESLSCNLSGVNSTWRSDKGTSYWSLLWNCSWCHNHKMFQKGERIFPGEFRQN